MCAAIAGCVTSTQRVAEFGSLAVIARMANSRIIKVLTSIAVVLVVIGLFALWANYKIHRIPIPKREKLADCTSESFSFPLTVRYHDPYQFVLGLPHASTGQLSFRGEVQVSQSTGLVARIPISSDDITPCNWLDPKPGLAGYILTWSRTNRGERLDDILVRGQSYNVQVAFSQSPPRDSSIWISSIGRVGEP